MATNFLYAAGTNGYTTSPFTCLTTELNSVTTGSLATLGAAKSESDTGQSIFAYVWLKAGGAFTPTGTPSLNIWFILSTDGGTTFEKSSAAPPRPADCVLPLAASAYSTNDIVYAPGLIRLPTPTFKVLLQNNSGVTLPSSGNTLTIGPIAQQF